MRERRPKELRDVRQLGWPISVNYLDSEWEKDERAEAREIAFRASAQFGIPPGYVQDRLHDGRVLRLKARPDRLYLEVDDWEYGMLAMGLQARLGQPGRFVRMPVVYDFRDCDFVTAYYVEDTGRLLPASLGRIERNAKEFLFTSVMELTPEKLVWACCLWCPKHWKEAWDERMKPTVVVSSASPGFRELHRPVWERLFGPDWLWVYDRYREVHEEVFLHRSDHVDTFLDAIGVPDGS